MYLLSTEQIEMYQSHPNFCKAYTKWARLRHHMFYLACLFKIEDSGLNQQLY